MKAIEIDKKHIVVYALLAALIAISLQLNLNKGPSWISIIINYIPGVGFLFLGLSWKTLTKKQRIAFIIAGAVFLGYMALFYLLGFHNPNWNN